MEEKGEKKTVKPSSDHHQHQLAAVVATNCQLELKVASSHGWVLEKERRRENGKQIILHHHPPFCPNLFQVSSAHRGNISKVFRLSFDLLTSLSEAETSQRPSQSFISTDIWILDTSPPRHTAVILKLQFCVREERLR